MKAKVDMRLEEALVLSGRKSVEWMLYNGQRTEVSLAEIKGRLSFLRQNLKPKFPRYSETIAAYLESELQERESNPLFI